jgi:DNA-binding IclR family transcriptional regulator
MATRSGSEGKARARLAKVRSRASGCSAGRLTRSVSGAAAAVVVSSGEVCIDAIGVVLGNQMPKRWVAYG